MIQLHQGVTREVAAVRPALTNPSQDGKTHIGYTLLPKSWKSCGITLVTTKQLFFLRNIFSEKYPDNAISEQDVGDEKERKAFEIAAGTA